MNYDYKEVQEQFDKVYRFSQIPNEEVNFDSTPLFEKWKKNKERFIRAFGGELIYEVGKVSYGQSNEQRLLKINSLISDLRYAENRISYKGYKPNRYGDLADLLEKEKESNDILNNKLSFSWAVDENVTINPGSKISKSFKHYINDSAELRRYQDEFSQALQGCATGILCFSVHPLDFLSLSENKSNWSTCQTLSGEYKAGILSLMCDSSTVIAYIRNENGYINELPDFPYDVLWNDKKWRMLIETSEYNNAVFLSRQYPYTLKDTTEIGDKFIALLKSSYVDWSNSFVKSVVMENGKEIELPFNHKTYYLCNKVYDALDLLDNTDALNYNDLLFSTVYKEPYYTYEKNSNLSVTFNIGSKVTCPICGKTPIESTEFMMCDNCEWDYGGNSNDVIGFCDECGTRISYNDYGSCYSTDYGCYCYCCANKITEICSGCKEETLISDMTYYWEDGSYLCPDCVREREEQNG